MVTSNRSALLRYLEEGGPPGLEEHIRKAPHERAYDVQALVVKMLNDLEMSKKTRDMLVAADVLLQEAYEGLYDQEVVEARGED